MQNILSILFTFGGLVVTYFVFYVVTYPYISSQKKYLDSQTWVGLKKETFSRLRASFRVVSQGRSMVAEGYEKFSKNNKVFLLPQMSRPPFLVLPADKVQEFHNLSDDFVDHTTIGSESIAGSWTIGPEFQDQGNFTVVRRQLTRKLPLLTTDVYAELVLSMKQNWPVQGSEPKAFKIYPTTMKIVSRAANRVFCGKELCRNQEFLDHSRMFAQEVFKSGAIMSLLPSIIHPVAGRWVRRNCEKHVTVCKRIASPIIEKRIKQMREQGKDYVPAVDCLQWILDDAFEMEATDPRKMEVDFLCRQMLILNMVAIHTTSMVMSNTLMDLYSNPHRDEVVAGLREECSRVLAEFGGEWNKDAVNSLLRVDSVIRETMRLSTLGEIAAPRIVKKPGGVTLSGGIHIPRGVRVTIPARAIQTDDSFYPDALSWDGFRFSRPREQFLANEAAQAEGKTNDLVGVLEQKNRGLIVTSDQFISFGIGRHSCPGRFFASQEMKLMLAHIVMSYDMKIDGGRPDNMRINMASVPREASEILISKRKY